VVSAAENADSLRALLIAFNRLRPENTGFRTGFASSHVIRIIRWLSERQSGVR
jgi:hypothetical protein